MSDREEEDGSLPDDDYDEANVEGDFMEEDEVGPDDDYETEDDEPPVRSMAFCLCAGAFFGGWLLGLLFRLSDEYECARS